MQDYEALLKLQDIDLELMRINSKLKAMPQQKKLAAVEMSKKKLQRDMTKVLGQRKDAQMDLDQNEAERLHLLDVQRDIRAQAQAENDHRHMADYENSLSTLAKKIEKCEHLRGQLEENLATIQKAEANAHALMDRIDQEEAAIKQSLQEDSADLMKHVAELARDRKRMLSFLDEKTQADYDKAFKRFHGLAVERLQVRTKGKIDEWVPSVCRVSLQSSQRADLVRKGSITSCPYCHRMLVTKED